MDIPTGVLIAVTRAAFRAVLATSLHAAEAIRVVGLTQGMAGTARAVHSLEPDVVILDLFPRDEENLSAAATFADLDQSLHVIVLGHSRDPSTTGKNVTYLALSADFDDLTELIRSRDEAQTDAARAETSDPLLTPAERRVAALVAEGYPNRRIGEMLHLSEKTVRNYLSSVLAKLGLANRTELAAMVVRSDGLILEQDRG